MINHVAYNLTLDVMGELPGTGIGEVHAIVGSQPPGLAIDVGTGLNIPTILVETMPALSARLR